jgi:cytochrome P450
MTDFADRWGFSTDKFWLRGEQPAEQVEFDENLGLWHVYGYPEVAEVLNDSAAFSTDSGRLFEVDEETAKYFEGDLAQMTGAEHAHMRKQVSRAFSPRAMDDLESRIFKLASELLDGLAGRDRFDLLADFVDDLSGTLFSELLGTPVAERGIFNLVDQTMDNEAQMTTVDQGDGANYFADLVSPLRPLRDFLGAHIDERRKQPREDLLSLMVQFRKLDGTAMSQDEVINFAISVLGAGHLTSPILIGNTTLCLESHPDQAERVRADRTLVPTLLEESMRFLTPGNASYRATSIDVEVGGKKIPKDKLVMLWFGTANRDPRQFADPNTFDASRHPNPHLGFGRGAHYCVGAQMARVETRIVFNILMDRFPTLRVDPDIPPVFFGSPDFTGVRSVSVRTS